MTSSVDDYPEPVRILSDLHLGHPGCRISSGEQLRPLLEGAGTVILNGDTMEMRACSYRAEAERLFGELRELIEGMGIRLEVLTGNHDPSIAERHHADLCGEEILVTHGDVLFPEIAPWSVQEPARLRKILEYDRKLRQEHGDGFEECLTRVKRVCEFTAVFEPNVKRGLRGKLFTLASLVWPPWKWLIVVGVWIRQKKLAAAFCEEYRPRAKGIVFGHTHYAGAWTVGDRVVVNTGGYLALGRALLVEIAEGELRTFAVRRRSDGVFVRGSQPQFRAPFGVAARSD